MTVAIPLQLNHQWITIGWALEGAALAWLYRRIPHRGLLCSRARRCWRWSSCGWRSTRQILIVRAARDVRILNWYLYTYLDLRARRCSSPPGGCRSTDDRLRGAAARLARRCRPAGVILLFLLLNIEIADFYATGPTITFRFGVDAGAGSDLHDRLAGLRPAAADRRHLPAQSRPAGSPRSRSSRSRRSRLPVRPGIARRPVSRRRRSSAWRCRSSLVSLALQKFVLHAPKEHVVRAIACALRRASPSRLAHGARHGRGSRSRRRFAFERPIDRGGPGPRRLAVDVPLLVGGGRSRVFDVRPATATTLVARRRPERPAAVRRVRPGVPYLLVHGRQEPGWQPRPILPVAGRHERRSQRVRSRPRRAGRDRSLADRRAFRRRFSNACASKAAATARTGRCSSAKGTLFDLPDERLRQTELSLHRRARIATSA